MSDTDSVSTREFDEYMGENPLGDREGLKAVGPYIVEYYRNPIGTNKRRREGDPEQSVIQIYRRRRDEEDHFRPWVKMCTWWALTTYKGREEFDALENPEQVERFAAAHADE